MGKVYLVGAGPFNKDLITVKGKKLISKADVIVYDYLANEALLEDRPKGCRVIYVGKSAGNHTMTQEEINRLLVELGDKNESVVRLKGGDPYVFGRGGEEGVALFEAGIDFEVVPGITSTIGGLAYAGVPVTSRGVATSFHVLTGHFKDDSSEHDYESLAKLNGTLVFVMGVKNLRRIVEGLIEAGKSVDTPVAIIYRASSPYQRVTEGTLKTIVGLAERNDVKPPSLIVIGDVIHNRDQLDFFGNRVLTGKTVVVTRSRAGQSKFSEALIEAGARVIQIPTIKTQYIGDVELEEKVHKAGLYDKVIFTSGIAVERFFDKMAILGYDNRHLGNVEIVAIGIETAKKLKRYGINADHIPERFTNEHVLELLVNVCKKGEKLLIPRSAKGDTEFIMSLEQQFDVDEVKCYDTLSVSADEIEDIGSLKDSVLSADYLTFTSSSTVQGFADLFGSDTLREYDKKVVAIGPKTRETIRSYGASEDLMPERYTIQAMVECIEEDAQV